ncbi:M16 family metallopeptidase [Lysobacter silvisoli]|uniref:Insulinase family protein n=1 Tax=Lysobacter silvisoli TaxID=2293254 RepID=A0A371K0C2_9GAMM|nr:pitrilysin family protein [Lysobacter silvisoli]RDZ27369.1 insulinase family protein [Lysobacter silvisoli]
MAAVREQGYTAQRLAGNGLNVLHLPLRTAPVALLMLTYDVGSRHESMGTRGVSHMLEHMMFKGSARYHKGEGRSIHQLLLPLGAQVNATTWYDRTNYFSLVPRDSLDLAADIEADRMGELRLDADELDTEIQVVLNEYDRCLSDPLEQLHQAVWQAAFPQHPYGRPVLGVREDIAGFRREQLYAHYRRHYRPDNATLTVIGDVDVDEAMAIAQRRFGDIEPGGAIAAVEAAAPPQDGERRASVSGLGAPGIVMLAYRAPPGLHADADALELLGAILAGGRYSRLHRRLVPAGLALEVWPSLSRLRQAGLWQLGAVLHPEAEHGRLEQAMREALAEVVRDGVSEEELTRARARIRGQLLTSRDGPLAIAMQLNEAIAAGDWRSYALAPERMAAVTATEVARVARAYLREDALTVGWLADAERLEPAA